MKIEECAPITRAPIARAMEKGRVSRMLWDFVSWQPKGNSFTLGTSQVQAEEPVGACDVQGAGEGGRGLQIRRATEHSL